MSKATNKADSVSATTTEAPSVDEARTPHATARALQVKRKTNTSPLYGTDRAAARRILDAINSYSSDSEIETVTLSRYGKRLVVEIEGQFPISLGKVERRLPPSYSVYDLSSHKSGRVDVTLMYDH